MSTLTQFLAVYLVVMGHCATVQAQESLGPALNQLFESAKKTKPGSASRQQADENFQSVARSSKRNASPQLGGIAGSQPEPEAVEIISTGKPRLIEFSGKKKK